MAFKKYAKKNPKMKLSYFDIAATPGEKLRLALVLTVGKDGFEDDRIKFADWQTKKPTTKYGQMPVMTIDGVEHNQSGALLRFIGTQLGGGTLYPIGDPAMLIKIEEALGVMDDLQRAFTPALYVGMRPKYLGYSESGEGWDKPAKVKEMRETFLKEELPKYMGYFTKLLAENNAGGEGGFICGPKLTIADCALYPQLNYFTKGVADHVPKDCLEPFPAVTAYLKRVQAIPAINDWYGLGQSNKKEPEHH